MGISSFKRRENAAGEPAGEVYRKAVPASSPGATRAVFNAHLCNRFQDACERLFERVFKALLPPFFLFDSLSRFFRLEHSILERQRAGGLSGAF
jgi:hypothetical protein